MPFNQLYLSIALFALGTSVACAEGSAAKGQDLPKIVLTANLTEQKIASVPASVTVVTAKDIENSAATSLAEVLGKTVGVQNYNSGGRDKLTIRGVRESYGVYTLILVNGKRISSTGALWRDSDFDISSIPLESIQRVEVVRGPMSSLYGSDAMGGVINIITKKPTPDWHGSASAEYHVADRGTGKDQYRLGVSATGALTDHLGLAISAEQYDRDAWFNKGKEASPAYYIEGKNTQNLRSTLTWDITPGQSLDLDVGYNKDERPYGMDAAFPQWNFYGYSAQELERQSASLTHRGDWGWGKTNVSVLQENSEIQDYDSDFDQPQHRTLKEKNTNIKAYTNVNLWINKLVLGAEYNNQEVQDKVSYKDKGKGEVAIASLFLQDDIQIIDPLTLTLGGRYDDHEVFGDNFSPKAYLIYKIADDVVVKGGFGAAFKAPSLAQLNKNYVIISCGGGANGCELRGNPNLDPETSKNYEIGFNLTKPTWNISATLFRNEVKDMISREVGNIGTPDSWARWVNLHHVKIKGAELEAGVDLWSHLFLDANATYLDAKDQNDKRLEERPRLQANTDITVKVIDALSFSAGASHIRDQLYGGKKLPDYTLVNIGGVAEIYPSLKLKFGVKNLKDVDLEEKGDKAATRFNAKELGRNYYVGLTYKF